MGNRALLFAILNLIFITRSVNAAEPLGKVHGLTFSDEHAGQRGAAQSTPADEAEGKLVVDADNVAAARDAIRDMRAIKLGLKPSPHTKREDEEGTKYDLWPLEDDANHHATALFKAFESGDLQRAMHELLIEGDHWNSKMEAEIFKEALKDLSPDEITKVSAEYTVARKELRKVLLQKVQDLLKSKHPNDPRVKALIAAIGKAGVDNLKAFDHGRERILLEKVGSPLCFTCGDPIKTKLEEGKYGQDYDYDFSGKMDEAGERELLAAGLLAKQGKGSFNGTFGVTSKGKVAIVKIDNQGRMLAELSPEMTNDAKLVAANDAALSDEVAKYYRGVKEQYRGWPSSWGKTDKDKVDRFITVVNPEVQRLAAAKKNAGGAVATAQPEPFDLASYLTANKTPPTGEYKPEALARHLGLVHPVTKEPFIRHAERRATKLEPAKNPDGTPFLNPDGTQETVGWHNRADDKGQSYNVDIEFDAIAKLPVDEMEVVANTLDGVRRAGIGPFKKTHGYLHGHCLWCNLANYRPTQENMRLLRSYIETLKDAQKRGLDVKRIPVPRFVYSQEYLDWKARQK